MKIILRFFLPVFVCCFGLYSCYTPRYVYSPSTQNIPTLHKKNDVEFSGYYAGTLDTYSKKDNYNHGFDLHSAWAVSNHFAAMINESARWEKNGENDSFYAGDSSVLSYKRNFIELGVGYFSPIQYNQKMYFQLFAGAAFGYSDITDKYISNGSREDKYHNSQGTKIFLQPAIIFSPSQKFSAALSSRFTAIIFSKIHTNYNASELDNYILDSLTVSPVYFWEPAFSYTFGFKKLPVKLRLQGSISILLNHRFVEHRTGELALGLIADFSKKKKIKVPVQKD